jgi:hypothetical protein
MLLPLVAALLLFLAPEAPLTHRFLACGTETRIVEADGTVSWSYPLGSRDGWVLPSGNVLLAITRGDAFPGGGVREVTPAGQVVLEYRGTQDEVDTVQRLKNGHTLLSEAGPNPRLIEVDRSGAVVRIVPLSSQRENTHLQQRMSRQLPNGNFLVPHLLDRVVREVTADGRIVWEVKTPNMPFTAIRLKNGHTLIGCTLGDRVIEVDRAGKTVWQVSNDDLPGRPLNDCCGVQALPDGHIVVTAHHATGDAVKLIEITRDKKIVWTFTDGKPFGIHHFQILETRGKRLPWPALK